MSFLVLFYDFNFFPIVEAELHLEENWVQNFHSSF
jgi:hypothetical protein